MRGFGRQPPQRPADQLKAPWHDHRLGIDPMLKAAAEHAPTVRSDALADGLRHAKSIDFSYPSGPNDFSAPGVTTGGQYWRVTQFFTSCDCWRIIDPNFRRSFR